MMAQGLHSVTPSPSREMRPRQKAMREYGTLNHRSCVLGIVEIS